MDIRFVSVKLSPRLLDRYSHERDYASGNSFLLDLWVRSLRWAELPQPLVLYSDKWSSVLLTTTKQAAYRSCGSPLISVAKVRGIEDQAHDATTNKTSDRDGHDPGENQESNTLPIDSPEGAVAQTDAHSGAGDAH